MSLLRALITALVVLAASPGLAEAPCRPAGPLDRLTVDFNEVPLRDVVRFVSCAAQLNVILKPPSLSARTVTVVAPRPVSVSDLVPLLRAALRHAGLAVTRSGAYLVIRTDTDHVPSKSRSSKGR
jgi:type II secretory pathway component GspD/PulD (secretin)